MVYISYNSHLDYMNDLFFLQCCQQWLRKVSFLNCESSFSDCNTVWSNLHFHGNKCTWIECLMIIGHLNIRFWNIKCLFKLLPISIGYFFLFRVICRGFLYFLYFNHLSDIFWKLFLWLWLTLLHLMISCSKYNFIC